MGPANWLQPVVFPAKYCCSVFLKKNGSLGEIYSVLVVDVLLVDMFMTLGRDVYGDYELGFCG